MDDIQMKDLKVKQQKQKDSFDRMTGEKSMAELLHEDHMRYEDGLNQQDKHARETFLDVYQERGRQKLRSYLGETEDFEDQINLVESLKVGKYQTLSKDKNRLKAFSKKHNFHKASVRKEQFKRALNGFREVDTGIAELNEILKGYLKEKLEENEFSDEQASTILERRMNILNARERAMEEAAKGKALDEKDETRRILKAKMLISGASLELIQSAKEMYAGSEQERPNLFDKVKEYEKNIKAEMSTLQTRYENEFMDHISVKNAGADRDISEIEQKDTKEQQKTIRTIFSQILVGESEKITASRKNSKNFYNDVMVHLEDFQKVNATGLDAVVEGMVRIKQGMDRYLSKHNYAYNSDIRQRKAFIRKLTSALSTASMYLTSEQQQRLNDMGINFDGNIDETLIPESIKFSYDTSSFERMKGCKEYQGYSESFLQAKYKAMNYKKVHQYVKVRTGGIPGADIITYNLVESEAYQTRQREAYRTFATEVYNGQSKETKDRIGDGFIKQRLQIDGLIDHVHFDENGVAVKEDEAIYQENKEKIRDWINTFRLSKEDSADYDLVLNYDKLPANEQERLKDKKKTWDRMSAAFTKLFCHAAECPATYTGNETLDNYADSVVDLVQGSRKALDLETIICQSDLGKKWAESIGMSARRVQNIATLYGTGTGQMVLNLINLNKEKGYIGQGKGYTYENIEKYNAGKKIYNELKTTELGITTLRNLYTNEKLDAQAGDVYAKIKLKSYEKTNKPITIDELKKSSDECVEYNMVQAKAAYDTLLETNKDLLNEIKTAGETEDYAKITELTKKVRSYAESLQIMLKQDITTEFETLLNNTLTELFNEVRGTLDNMLPDLEEIPDEDERQEHDEHLNVLKNLAYATKDDEIKARFEMTVANLKENEIQEEKNAKRAAEIKKANEEKIAKADAHNFIRAKQRLKDMLSTKEVLKNEKLEILSTDAFGGMGRVLLNDLKKLIEVSSDDGNEVRTEWYDKICEVILSLGLVKNHLDYFNRSMPDDENLKVYSDEITGIREVMLELLNSLDDRIRKECDDFGQEQIGEEYSTFFIAGMMENPIEEEDIQEQKIEFDEILQERQAHFIEKEKYNKSLKNAYNDEDVNLILSYHPELKGYEEDLRAIMNVVFYPVEKNENGNYAGDMDISFESYNAELIQQIIKEKSFFNLKNVEVAATAMLKGLKSCSSDMASEEYCSSKEYFKQVTLAKGMKALLHLESLNKDKKDSEIIRNEVSKSTGKFHTKEHEVAFSVLETGIDAILALEKYADADEMQREKTKQEFIEAAKKNKEHEYEVYMQHGATTEQIEAIKLVEACSRGEKRLSKNEAIKELADKYDSKIFEIYERHLCGTLLKIPHVNEDGELIGEEDRRIEENNSKVFDILLGDDTQAQKELMKNYWKELENIPCPSVEEVLNGKFDYKWMVENKRTMQSAFQLSRQTEIPALTEGFNEYIAENPEQYAVTLKKLDVLIQLQSMMGAEFAQKGYLISEYNFVLNMTNQNATAEICKNLAIQEIDNLTHMEELLRKDKIMSNLSKEKLEKETSLNPNVDELSYCITKTYAYHSGNAADNAKMENAMIQHYKDFFKGNLDNPVFKEVPFENLAPVFRPVLYDEKGKILDGYMDNESYNVAFLENLIYEHQGHAKEAVEAELRRTWERVKYMQVSPDDIELSKSGEKWIKYMHDIYALSNMTRYAENPLFKEMLRKANVTDKVFKTIVDRKSYIVEMQSIWEEELQSKGIIRNAKTGNFELDLGWRDKQNDLNAKKEAVKKKQEEWKKKAPKNVEKVLSVKELREQYSKEEFMRKKKELGAVNLTEDGYYIMQEAERYRTFASYYQPIVREFAKKNPDAIAKTSIDRMQLFLYIDIVRFDDNGEILEEDRPKHEQNLKNLEMLFSTDHSDEEKVDYFSDRFKKYYLDIANVPLEVTGTEEDKKLTRDKILKVMMFSRAAGDIDDFKAEKYGKIWFKKLGITEHYLDALQAVGAAGDILYFSYKDQLMKYGVTPLRMASKDELSRLPQWAVDKGLTELPLDVVPLSQEGINNLQSDAEDSGFKSYLEAAEEDANHQYNTIFRLKEEAEKGNYLSKLRYDSFFKTKHFSSFEELMEFSKSGEEWYQSEIKTANDMMKSVLDSFEECKSQGDDNILEKLKDLKAIEAEAKNIKAKSPYQQDRHTILHRFEEITTEVVKEEERIVPIALEKIRGEANTLEELEYQAGILKELQNCSGTSSKYKKGINERLNTIIPQKRENFIITNSCKELQAEYKALWENDSEGFEKDEATRLVRKDAFAKKYKAIYDRADNWIKKYNVNFEKLYPEGRELLETYGNKLMEESKEIFNNSKGRELDDFLFISSDAFASNMPAEVLAIACIDSFKMGHLRKFVTVPDIVFSMLNNVDLKVPQNKAKMESLMQQIAYQEMESYKEYKTELDNSLSKAPANLNDEEKEEYAIRYVNRTKIGLQIAGIRDMKERILKNNEFYKIAAKKMQNNDPAAYAQMVQINTAISKEAAKNQGDYQTREALKSIWSKKNKDWCVKAMKNQGNEQAQIDFYEAYMKSEEGYQNAVSKEQQLLLKKKYGILDADVERFFRGNMIQSVHKTVRQEDGKTIEEFDSIEDELKAGENERIINTILEGDEEELKTLNDKFMDQLFEMESMTLEELQKPENADMRKVTLNMGEYFKKDGRIKLIPGLEKALIQYEKENPQKMRIIEQKSAYFANVSFCWTTKYQGLGIDISDPEKGIFIAEKDKFEQQLLIAEAMQPEVKESYDLLKKMEYSYSLTAEDVRKLFEDKIKSISNIENEIDYIIALKQISGDIEKDIDLASCQEEVAKAFAYTKKEFEEKYAREKLINIFEHQEGIKQDAEVDNFVSEIGEIANQIKAFDNELQKDAKGYKLYDIANRYRVFREKLSKNANRGLDFIQQKLDEMDARILKKEQNEIIATYKNSQGSNAAYLNGNVDEELLKRFKRIDDKNRPIMQELAQKMVDLQILKELEGYSEEQGLHMDEQEREIANFIFNSPGAKYEKEYKKAMKEIFIEKAAQLFKEYMKVYKKFVSEAVRSTSLEEAKIYANHMARFTKAGVQYAGINKILNDYVLKPGPINEIVFSDDDIPKEELDEIAGLKEKLQTSLDKKENEARSEFEKSELQRTNEGDDENLKSLMRSIAEIM